MNANQIFPSNPIPADMANMANEVVGYDGVQGPITYQMVWDAFAAVTANMDDWRGPINARIHVPAGRKWEAANLVSKAVEFFTATTPRINMREDCAITVVSIGYRNGPAGC